MAGGAVQFQNFPPASQIHTYLHRLRPELFDRVTSISFGGVPFTHEMAEENSQLSRVTSIDCVGCGIDRKHLAAIAKLRGLDYLLLHNNPMLNDDDMKLLHRLPNLTSVGTDGTYISLLALRHFLRSSDSRKQLRTDQALRSAAPIKMNKACNAVKALRPLNRNSISGLSHQVSMYKKPRSECLEMCRILKNSHTIVILKLVQTKSRMSSSLRSNVCTCLKSLFSVPVSRIQSSSNGSADSSISGNSITKENTFTS